MIQNRRGFTLVEVMIASALAMVLIGGFLQIMASQNKIASEEVQETASQNGITDAISTLLPMLQEAQPTATHKADGQMNEDPIDKFQFRVPFKMADGSFGALKYNSVKNIHEFEYGAGEPGFMTIGNYYEIQFIPNYDKGTGVGRRDELIEEATLQASTGVVGIDLNNDGDRLDEFVFGTLMVREFTAAKVLISERVLGGRICVPYGTGRVFAMRNTTLMITLSYLDIREAKPELSRLRTTQTTVNLRNGVEQ